MPTEYITCVSTGAQANLHVSPLTFHPRFTDTCYMRRMLAVITTTLAVVAGTCAAIVGVDWLWHTAPSAAPVVAVLGDPHIRLATALPEAPNHAAIYRTGREYTDAEVLAVIPGKLTRMDGWLFWRGRVDASPRDVMRRLNPGIPWRAHKGHLGPAPDGDVHGITAAVLSSAFTGTEVQAASFGVYSRRNGRLDYLSIPDHRIVREGSVKVISAGKAFLDLSHHRANAAVVPVSVPLLPTRLTRVTRVSVPSPVTDVRLVQARDPDDLTISRPIWVFADVGEVTAAR